MWSDRHVPCELHAIPDETERIESKEDLARIDGRAGAGRRLLPSARQNLPGFIHR